MFSVLFQSACSFMFVIFHFLSLLPNCYWFIFVSLCFPFVNFLSLYSGFPVYDSFLDVVFKLASRYNIHIIHLPSGLHPQTRIHRPAVLTVFKNRICANSSGYTYLLNTVMQRTVDISDIPSAHLSCKQWKAQMVLYYYSKSLCRVQYQTYHVA